LLRRNKIACEWQMDGDLPERHRHGARRPVVVRNSHLRRAARRNWNRSKGWRRKTGKKNPRSVVRGLESTEVVEETDFTIHGLLRRTKACKTDVCR